MIVVTGGIASGKKTYLQTCGIDVTSAFDARAFSDSTAELLRKLESAQVVLHVEELVRTGALDQQAQELLFAMHAVTCTEVGSGVIPLTWDDRVFRERAGSLSSLLASKAQCVVRMVCGIPVALKGTLPAAGEAGEAGEGSSPSLSASPSPSPLVHAEDSSCAC